MASFLTIDHVRNFINDHPDANHRLGDVEFSDQRIQEAMQFTVADFNETPPMLQTQQTVENFGYPRLLLYGTAAHLYRGEAAKQERNHLPYSTGGVSVNDSSHFAQYLQLSQTYDSKYEDSKQKIKVQINLNQGWGDIHSEYSNLPVI